MQGRAACQFAPKIGSGDTPGRAGALHQRAQGCDFDAEGEVGAQHPFATHHADLQSGMLVDLGNQRNEAVDRKVDVPGCCTRLVDHVGQDQMDRFADVQQTPTVVAREQFDEVVLDRGQGMHRGSGTSHSARNCPVRLSASAQT